METIGIGIIGFGWFGELIADTIVNTPSLCLVAIAEPNPERREWLGMKFPEVRPYDAAEQLLGDKNLSVVVVATPPVLHT
ncbi:MAG: Gfo/Idh/MocA family oxidoreductase, partial [Syntrophomonadaceae bacterium]